MTIKPISKRLMVFFFWGVFVSTLPSQNRLVAGESKPIRLREWLLLETKPDAGKYVEASASEGFVVYEGKYLPHDPEFPVRMYTFRTDFTLDETVRGTELAIAMGPGDYPREVYLNGIRLAKTGDHGTRYNATVYYSSRISLPPQLLKYGEEANKIAVEAYPAYETSPLGDFHLGTFAAITRVVFLRNFFNVNLVQSAVVVALIISTFFFFLFFSSMHKDPRYLYFAITCLAFSLGYINMSLYHDGMNDVLLDKLSRIGLPFTNLFLAFFAIHFSGLGIGRKWLKPLLFVPVLVCAVITSVQPDKGTLAAAFSNFTTNFVLTPGLVYILVLLLINFFRNRNAASFAVLAGYLVSVGASFHDIIYISLHIAPFCYLVAYGYLALLVSIFFVLALEQAKISADLTEQSARLNRKNESLNEMVSDLTAVSEGFVSASMIFESKLGETIESVESYGHKNQEILDVFGNQVQGIQREIEELSSHLALSSERVPEAVRTQTAVVETVNSALSDMDARISKNLDTAAESSKIAEDLAKGAEDGLGAIGLSRSAISKVAEYSGTLEGVLASIEDIAERTHVLSINAAIESAKSGAEGRGFGVVAQEIRKLADQSRSDLKSSFEKIREMANAVTKSSLLSESVSGTLRELAGLAKKSAEKTADIKDLIESQREKSSEALRSADRLLVEARTLNSISLEEKNLNDDRMARFLAMKDALLEIIRRLETQDIKREALFEALGTIKQVMESNARHIADLKKAIGKAQVFEARL